MKERSHLVTGGAGFIGSHLVDLLMEKGHTVIVLDDLSHGNLENLREHEDDPRFRFVRGDVTGDLDQYLSERVLGGAPPLGTIFHLAARVDVTSSFESPETDAITNYVGTLKVLDHALRRNVERVVLASSAAVYSDSVPVPTSEEDPTEPLSPYGLHKLTSERMLEIYRKQWGLSTVSLRFFNVYGPRQRPDDPYSGVISKFTGRALSGEPLIIYGDGEQTRDLVYVKDLVRWVAAAAGSDVNGPVNLGTGVQTSVNQLADMIRGMVDTGSGVVHSARRKGELLHSCADISRLSECCDVELTPIGEGLKRTVEWFGRNR